MTTVYMLSGMPASGKSTYVNDNLAGIPVVSTDAYIEEYARLNNKTYNDVFLDVIKTATKRMNEFVDILVQTETSFVWDQTNLSVKSRKAKLDKIPKHWEKIAIYFHTPEETEWQRRLNSRPGKTVPINILKSMLKTIEIPTVVEGFFCVMEIPDNF